MIVDKPLVSIALCTYNGEKYITGQLDSIINQDYPNLEIIIIDDKSTDDTVNILKSFQEKHNIIKLFVNQANIGFNKNFKKALDNCSAEYIAIADQDDIWFPEKISVLMNGIKDNLLFYHDSEYIDESGIRSGKTTRSHHRFVNGDCSKNLLYYNCISGHASLIRKELINLTPKFSEKLYYDWWLAYTAACTGRIDYTTEILVKHRKHPASSTGKDKTDPKALRVEHLNLFVKHALTPESLRRLVTNLLSGYAELKQKKFSKNLFHLLITNYKGLFYIRKRSLLSQLKLIIKESSV